MENWQIKLNIIIKQLNRLLLNPYLLIISIFLFFYLHLIFIINPLLDVYEKFHDAINEKKQKLFIANQTYFITIPKLQVYLKNKYPNLKFKYTNTDTNNIVNCNVLVSSFAEAINILQFVISNNAPIIKKFTIDPFGHKKFLKLSIFF